jgi:hypothetical protein
VTFPIKNIDPVFSCTGDELAEDVIAESTISFVALYTVSTDILYHYWILMIVELSINDTDICDIIEVTYLFELENSITDLNNHNTYRC